MNLIPWHRKFDIPVTRESALSTPAAQLRTEMDQLFDRFFRGPWTLPPAWLDEPRLKAFLPEIDVIDGEKQLTVTAEIPGMDPDDIEIDVSDNVLTIHGEKKETHEDKGDDHYHCERRFGSFTRSIELPRTANVDEVTAEHRRGVLTITVAKLPATKPRKKIDVRKTSEVA